MYETSGSIIDGNVIEDNDHSGLSLDISFDRNIVSANQILRNGKLACGIHPSYAGNHPGVFIAAGHGNLFNGNF